MVASTSCATRRGSYAANRVIEVLRSLRGTAVGAALCKALKAARSSPSSIGTARVSLDYRSIRIIRERSILEEVRKRNICSGKGRRPYLRERRRRQRRRKRRVENHRQEKDESIKGDMDLRDPCSRIRRRGQEESQIHDGGDDDDDDDDAGIVHR